MVGGQVFAGCVEAHNGLLGTKAQKIDIAGL
jgi:hypothetical protein